MKRNLSKIKTISILMLIFTLGLVFTSFSSHNGSSYSHSSKCLTNILRCCQTLQSEIKAIDTPNITKNADVYPGQYGQYAQYNQNNQYSQYNQANQAADSTVSAYQAQNTVCPQPEHNPYNCPIEDCYQCNAFSHGHSGHNGHCGH